MSIDPDSHAYRMFTGRQNCDKAMQTLDGLLQGMLIDGVVNRQERAELLKWIAANEEARFHHPSIDDAISMLKRVLEDGEVTPDELEELRHFCRERQHVAQYYDEVTHIMQRLHGLLHGLLADGHLSDSEIAGLETWLEEHFGLREFWPISEIETLVVKAMQDRRLDEIERVEIAEYFRSFTQVGSAETRISGRVVKGICATDPEIRFIGSVFCITGRSERCSRKAFIDHIERRGGGWSNQITAKTNYLVVCAEANACWAYASYGRKVEQAIRIRESGIPLLIIHERDFWDAVVN